MDEQILLLMKKNKRLRERIDVIGSVLDSLINLTEKMPTNFNIEEFQLLKEMLKEAIIED